MRLQEFLVRATQRSLSDLVRAATAVPEDKVDWSPGGSARSCLSQMREAAMSGSWFIPAVRERRGPEPGGHKGEEDGRPDLSTLEACIAEAQRSTSLLCQVILETPDAALEDELKMPFSGGVVMMLADVMELHRWNLVYHLGQINQIQLMLGDRVMH